MPARARVLILKENTICQTSCCISCSIELALRKLTDMSRSHGRRRAIQQWDRASESQPGIAVHASSNKKHAINNYLIETQIPTPSLA
eukprot:4577469-Amphidinium_carterae.1